MLSNDWMTHGKDNHLEKFIPEICLGLIGSCHEARRPGLVEGRGSFIKIRATLRQVQHVSEVRISDGNQAFRGMGKEALRHSFTSFTTGCRYRNDSRDTNHRSIKDRCWMMDCVSPILLRRM